MTRLDPGGRWRRQEACGFERHWGESAGCRAVGGDVGGGGKLVRQASGFSSWVESRVLPWEH